MLNKIPKPPIKDRRKHFSNPLPLFLPTWVGGLRQEIFFTYQGWCLMTLVLRHIQIFFFSVLAKRDLIKIIFFVQNMKNCFKVQKCFRLLNVKMKYISYSWYDFLGNLRCMIMYHENIIYLLFLGSAWISLRNGINNFQTKILDNIIKRISFRKHLTTNRLSYEKHQHDYNLNATLSQLIVVS